MLVRHEKVGWKGCQQTGLCRKCENPEYPFRDLLDWGEGSYDMTSKIRTMILQNCPILDNSLAMILCLRGMFQKPFVLFHEFVFLITLQIFLMHFLRSELLFSC